MHMAAVAHPELALGNREPICPEDSSFRKGISYIPFVGLICGWFQELSLAEQISQPQPREKMIELLSVKNDYKLAQVANCLISIAILIAGVALSFFLFSEVTSGIGFMVVYGGMSLYGLNRNSESIERLRANDEILGRVY